MKTAIRFVPTSGHSKRPKHVTDSEAWVLLRETYRDEKECEAKHAALLAKACGCVSVVDGMLEPTP